MLLDFCHTTGARILNGRVPNGRGTPSRDVTSFGTSMAGAAVVDYFLADPSLFPSFTCLTIAREHPAAQLSDHALLRLSLSFSGPTAPSLQAFRPSYPAAAPSESPTTSALSPNALPFSPALAASVAPPSWTKFSLDQARLPDAVAALEALAPRLAAIAALAEAATCQAGLDAVAAARSSLVVEALSSAGMPLATPPNPRRRRALPRPIRQQFGISQHRNAVRLATRLGDAARSASSRCKLRNALRRAHHAAAALRGERLEAMISADPASFFTTYRPSRAPLPAHVDPAGLAAHFRHLLASPTAPAAPVSPSPTTNPPAPALSHLAPAFDPSSGPTAQVPLPTTTPPPGPPPPSFTEADVAAAIARTPAGKSVTGPLPPWLLKAAPAALVPLLTAEFNAWQRVGCLAADDARSVISPILKPGADPSTYASYRGIAVGSLPAKLYASILERQLSDWAETNNLRAEGQYGFRRQRGTAHPAFVLRTLIEQTRANKGQLWTCFVDFKQAYDTVPRQQLWAKLSAAGLDPWHLRALQALYASVPMTVRTPAGLSSVFQALLGVKQGCPASCTLFGLYVDDLPAAIASPLPDTTPHSSPASDTQLPSPAPDAQPPAPASDITPHSSPASDAQPPSPAPDPLPPATAPVATPAPATPPHDPPHFLPSNQPVPTLLYADDTTLTSNSAAGLQEQLRRLEAYCARNGLTVNASKTKLMLFDYTPGRGHRPTAESMLATAKRARLTFAGEELAAVSTFTYLGTMFSSADAFAAAAAPERVRKARAAMYSNRARCAELGLESAAVQQQLFTTMVTPILTYGAEVWAPQLIPKAATASHTGGGSKSEQLQIQYLRHLLGVRQNTPVAAILAETGELPLWIRWLEQAVRLWNYAASEPEDSLVHIALAANTHLALHSPAAQLARQTWSKQLASSLSILGLELDLAAPAPIPTTDLRTTALAHHLSLCTAASLAAGATMFHYYFQEVLGGDLSPDTYGPAAYLADVRKRHHRQALAQIRTGSHWLTESTGRMRRTPREQRTCPTCTTTPPPPPAPSTPGPLETTTHATFRCPLYADIRPIWPDLFPPAASPTTPPPPPLSLATFLLQPADQLAPFYAACKRRWETTHSTQHPT